MGINECLDNADLNAVRMAVYQATRDPALEHVRLVQATARGGATHVLKIAPEDVELVKARARHFLSGMGSNRAPESVPSHLNKACVRDLMEMALGRKLSEKEFHFQRPSLALEGMPRAASWSKSLRSRADGSYGEVNSVDDFSALIIGAGFSGIAMAVQLEHLGIPYTLLEKRGEVGGTWSRNTYPGVRVDTSSFNYQFSFIKNFPWSEHFATGAEVREYAEHVCKETGIEAHLHLGCEVIWARWDEKACVWTVGYRENGRVHERQARFVISATGLFSVPRRLDVPGRPAFLGKVIHTSDWPEQLDLAGKNVAIVGTGSTGVQMLKHVAEAASHVTVVQRTPQWIVPRENYGAPVRAEERWLLDHLPNYWNWYVFLLAASLVNIQDLLEVDPEWIKSGGQVNERNDAFRESLVAYMEKQLGDRQDLIDMVTPDFPPMARRLIVDNEWYKSLRKSNVSFVKAGVECFTDNGIGLSDGTTVCADVVVEATGFEVSKYLWPIRVKGIGDVDLGEQWAASDPVAYHTVAAPGFPNLFIMYGPNAQPRPSSSTLSWMETWSRYIAQLLVDAVEGGERRLEVSESKLSEYLSELNAASASLVLGAARGSYFFDGRARQVVMSPMRLEDYHAILMRPNLSDYVTC